MRPAASGNGGVAGAGAVRCPFLREAEVRFCRASVYQKMIVRTPGSAGLERCSSPDYLTCPAARQRLDETSIADKTVSREGRHSDGEHEDPTCPFLQESLVQYCSAAAITKYIPYSESVLTRCGSSSFHYCDVYLSLAEPDARPLSWTREDERDPDPDASDVQIGSIRMPKGMKWAQNHMWLDEAEDGSCHVGVDAFLVAALGRVDHVSFPAVCGFQRPAVVLHVNGVDFPMIFPEKLFITAVNSRIKAVPERLTCEPYRQGWLVEGRTAPWGEDRGKSLIHGLLQGRKAARWMKDEIDRIDRFVHGEISPNASRVGELMADGGAAVHGAGRLLPREGLLKLFNEFFSPCEGRRGGS